MAVYNWNPDNYRHTKVSRFVEAFFSQLGDLQQDPRHPKWREVNLTAQLPGWNRFAPADEWLKQAIVANRSPLRTAFEEFVSENEEVATVPPEVKDSLFEEFIAWQNSRALTFALVPKAVNNPFFDLARDGCKQAESDLESVECLYIGPGEHTEQEQAQIVQDLIDRGIDGIAVSPSNAPLMAAVLRRAEEANIPVVTWDSDLLAEHASLRQAYVGTDNYEIGVNLAQLTMSLKPEGGSICIQSGGPEAANLNQRIQGIRDTLAGTASGEPPGVRLEGQGGWTEIAECPLFTSDDAAVAVQQMAEILAAHPDLDAFVPTGGWPQFVPAAYRQVVDPYKDRIASGDLAIVAADTLPMQMDLLGEGLSVGQVGQRPYEMGYRAMLLLKELLEGRPVEDPIFTGLDVCTQENLDSCLSG
ncbi:MAG: sugar-binding protein [Alphaproteobacteria bacterium]|nr:sugar-binding protein [Alphaproteobacteria bacterium]